MKKGDKKYIGTFSYFATGEGHRVYTCYFTVPRHISRADPSWIFYQKLMEKWAGGRGSINKDDADIEWGYFRNGIKIFDLEKVKEGWAKEASAKVQGNISPEQFESVAKLATEGSLTDGDFEFWVQYNRS